VGRTASRNSTPAASSTATSASAAAGDDAAITALASAGPIACMTVGRSVPSTPLAAIRSSGGRIDGSSAE
jgi:hypothetical protein